MNISTQQLRRVRQETRERLHQRQIQAAQYGTMADPIIMTEAHTLHEAIEIIDLALRMAGNDTEIGEGVDFLRRELYNLGVLI